MASFRMQDVFSGAGDRRRRIVTTVGLVVGTATLGLSLHIRPGSSWFYPATLILAAVWTVAAYASGPLPAGARAWGGLKRRGVVLPILVGVALGGVFVLGALIVREIPGIGDRVASVLHYADRGSLVAVTVLTVINGVAEELFFRGAVYVCFSRRRVLWSTVVYTVATAASGNVMLIFAAAVLGVVVGLERMTTRGLMAPALTHAAWALVMLFALRPLFG
jgi:uncharacterized protein